MELFPVFPVFRHCLESKELVEKNLASLVSFLKDVVLMSFAKTLKVLKKISLGKLNTCKKNKYSWNAVIVSQITLMNIELHFFTALYKAFIVLFNIYSSSRGLLTN